MTTDDPFFDGADSDRTVLKPTPGRRSGQGGGAAKPPPPPPPRGPAPGAQPAGPAPAALNLVTPGLNPLIDAAGPLLSLASQLRNTATHNDPGGLNQHIAQEIQRFEQNARTRGIKPESVLAARYALCTFLDEIVLTTPWGANSAWGNRTLLTTFHRESWGGEKFYAILDRVCQDPTGNVDLIELMYLCMLLGFEGKYRVQDRGAQQVAAVQDRLHAMLREQRAAPEQELSPRWRGVEDLRSPLARYVPLWVVAAGAAGLLALVYTGFLFSLTGASAPLVGNLQSIGRENAELVTRAPSKARRMNFAALLAPEIEQQLVDVVDQPGRSTITIRGSGLFAPGSPRVSAERGPLMLRIAEALNTEAGQVAISGHSDNIPISGTLRLRFPTNQELSQARADAVLALMVQHGVLPQRLSAEGRGEQEPLVANDSVANRAKNRRVEVVVSARTGLR